MYKDKHGNTLYKIGLHIHTNVSDGHVTPEDAARRYKAAGFDAIALTDHWSYHGEDEIEGLKILSGCEYNLGSADTIEGVMHIVGVGMDYAPDVSRDTPWQEVIDKINAAGGIAIFAHPAWSLNSCRDALALKGFSAVEIYNSVSDAHESTRPYSGYLIDLLANQGYILPLVATDDAHYYDGSDETKAYIMVNSKSLETEDILDAVRKGDFFASQGPFIFVRHDGNKVVVDCSECSLITFLSNSSWSSGRTLRGENLTHAEYTPAPFEKWVRVEVLDKNGNYAWSNIIRL